MGSKSAIAIVITVVVGAIYALFKETYWAVAVDFAFDHLARWLDVEKSKLIAAATPFIILLAAFSIVAIVAYRLGERDRNKEPIPDIDPRKAFERVLQNKKWVKANTETDPKKLQNMLSSYLNLRLDAQIHDALVQHKISAWGERDLPGTQTGPLAPIPSENWHDLEIVFGPSSAGERAVAKYRTQNKVAYFGIKLCAAEVAKYFHLSKRRLLS